MIYDNNIIMIIIVLWYDNDVIRSMTFDSYNHPRKLKIFKDLRGLWEYIFRRNLEPQTGQFLEKLYSLRGS